jgi:tetratricopeptide (TPR) repeat protein
MSRLKHFKAISVLLTAWLLVAAHAGADTVSRMSSRFLARGELALLEIAVSGEPPTGFPRIQQIPGVELQALAQRARPKPTPGRKMEFVFEFQISSYETGVHVLPAFEVMVGSKKTQTEPLEFVVFNPDELQWSEAVVGNIRFRYASAFRILNKHPYEGETTPVEIKVFVPRDLFVDDWGIPDFQRDGITSWRFQPSLWRAQINLLGMPYQSVAYPSTLTSTRPGKVGIGPATIRLMVRQVEMDGILRTAFREVHIDVPKLEIETTPLPKGAPEGFDNAVGSFKIRSETALTEVQEGDPVAVDIFVTGSGNLDTLRPPKPVDTAGWKVYEPTTDQRGDERRELSGTTVFHQFLRPLELKPAVPAFRFVYFDPKDKTYKTLTTEPIPLQMSPAMPPKADTLAPPQALMEPVERMTDILGTLHPADLTISNDSLLSGWTGHLIAALIALGLIGKALWMRNAHKFRKDPVREQRIRELREIEGMRNADDSGFLMSAGRFIERWLGANPSPEVRAVLAERDAVCFRQDLPNSTKLDPKRRDSILRVLRKAAMLWMAAALLETGTARADDLATQAQAAYDTAKYDVAIGLWLKAGSYEKLSPDTLFNIGNACYRAGSPGHAALYYRRALARDPSHQESRQNLRFIERKHGSITVHRPEYQYAIAKLSLSTWQGMLWTGAWICTLAALVFPATRPGARIRMPAVAALVAGPLLAACGGLGWWYFPNDAEFAAVERQAVIIGEKAILHSDAARTSPEVIDAPPGSLCEVIRESGRWAYVAFATKTRGWVPMENVEKVIPTTPPVPPTIRKPKADGKSA